MSKNTLLFDNSGRLRSGLRVAVFVLAAMAIAVPVTPSVAFLSQKLGITGSLPDFFMSGTILCAIALVAGWLCLHYLEKLPFSALGCSFEGTWLKDLSFGIALGGGTFGVAAVIGIATGSMSFTLNTGSDARSMMISMAASLIVLGTAAAFEEAFFRGYAFQTLVRSDLAWVAIAGTSIFFGAAHLMNPNSSKIALVNTVLAGVWFGIAYLKTRNLWFPFGLHLAWNWVQGNIFGIEISGLTSLLAVPLLKKTEHGPDWISGGAYGVEGGIVCTVALGLSIALIIWVPALKRFPVDGRQ